MLCLITLHSLSLREAFFIRMVRLIMFYYVFSCQIIHWYGVWRKVGTWDCWASCRHRWQGHSAVSGAFPVPVGAGTSCLGMGDKAGVAWRSGRSVPAGARTGIPWCLKNGGSLPSAAPDQQPLKYNFSPPFSLASQNSHWLCQPSGPSLGSSSAAATKFRFSTCRVRAK